MSFLRSSRSAPGGFSLIEVNLAIMLVALGLLGLFGLFPAGLREGEAGLVETHAAVFADYVLSGVRAKAGDISSWEEWCDIAQFRSAVRFNAGLDKMSLLTASPNTIQGPFLFPPDSNPDDGMYIKCVIDVAGDNGDTPGSAIRRVNLWVWSGEFGPSDMAVFKRMSQWYYTQVVYMGNTASLPH